MKSLFGALAIEDITASVENKITGAYSRRIWFFYDWLTTQVLPIEDVTIGKTDAKVELPTGHASVIGFSR